MISCHRSTALLLTFLELEQYLGPYQETVLKASKSELGSSVRGRSRISKVGNRKLRNLLFPCSFSACKHNRACREIYERITSKGKSKKLALIAVCNKLIKQAYGISRSGLDYDRNFVGRLS